MSLLYSAAATVSVAQNTSTLTIAGMDISLVQPGMTISLGARDRVTGDDFIIIGITPSGSLGGTVTTAGPVPTAYSNAGFVIDTRDFNGSAPNWLIAQYTTVLNTLLRVTGAATNLFSGSRQIALDKDNTNAIGRVLFSIAGRNWFGLEQRTVNGVETIAIRASADGTSFVDAIRVDANGGVLFGGPVRTVLGSAPSPSFSFDGDTNTGMFSPGADAIGFATNGGERLRITPAGDVGIGIAAPSAAVHVTRTAAASGLSACGYMASFGAFGAYYAGYLEQGVGGGAILSTNNGSGYIERLRIDPAGNFIPGADGSQTLGSANRRMGTIYSGNGAIQTSDANQKTPLRAYSDDELDAIGDVVAEGGVYRFLDAVAAKGEMARLHCGYTAQALRDALASRGLDPSRYAAFCADIEMETVTRRDVELVAQTETVQIETVEVREGNGQRYARIVMVPSERPVTESIPLLDAAGQPIPDEDGSYLTHSVPRMVERSRVVEVQQPVLGEGGHPVMRLGLRYDLVAAWALAWHRREIGRLVIRIDALEKKEA